MKVAVKGLQHIPYVETEYPPGSVTHPVHGGAWHVLYWTKSIQVEGSFQRREDARRFMRDLFMCPQVKRAWVVENV